MIGTAKDGRSPQEKKRSAWFSKDGGSNNLIELTGGSIIIHESTRTKDGQAPLRDEVINDSYFANCTTGGDRTVAESEGGKDFQVACASLRLFQMRSWFW